jgi:hypothetical protein
VNTAVHSNGIIQPKIRQPISNSFLKKGNWEGSSSINKYPALIKGNYSIAENAVIKFVETSPWTAEFDWTLILHGSYLLHRNDDSLIFTRSYANGYVDVFKLAKSK